MKHSSPFAHRLDTNYVPIPAEFDTINRVIDEQQVSVDAIQAEIVKLQTRLKVHTDLISKHRDLLTPARRVPSDILSTIFLTLAALPDEHHGRKPHPVVTVSHVCHLWRTLAIDNPLLWADINIHVPLYPHERNDRKPGEQEELVARWNRSLDRMCLRVEAFAHRAKECGLHVSYFAADAPREILLRWLAEPADDGGFGKALDPFIRLAGVTAKWQSLTIRLHLVTYGSPLFEILQFAEGVTAHMQDLHIEISCCMGLEMRDDIWPHYFPGGSMSIYGALRSYTAKMPYDDVCRIQLNWSALARLSIGSPHHTVIFGPQEAAYVLSVTPNIVHCTIQFSDGGVETQFVPQHRVISLPKLQSLDMRGSEVPVEFTSVLDLPSLTQLSTTQSFVHPRDDKNSAIVELIRRYGTQLTDIAFVCASVTPAALRLILDSLPNAASLDLVGEDPNVTTPRSDSNHEQPPYQGEGAVLDTLLLQRLTPGRDGADPNSNATCLCPKLRRLVCQFGAVDRDQDRLIKRLIVNLVCSRRDVSRAASLKRDGVAWLENITVLFNGGPIDWMLEEMKLGGVETRDVKFSARYRHSNTVPTSHSFNIPGVGELSFNTTLELMTSSA